jgi:hypothetical protein
MRALGKPSVKRRRFVKDLTAEGYNGDCIAQTLGISKNALRRRHALDLHAGRQIKAAEKAAAPRTKQERERAELIALIERSFQSEWYDPVHGNELYGGAHSVAEVLAWLDNARGEFANNKWACQAVTDAARARRCRQRHRNGRAVARPNDDCSSLQLP